jgi:glutaconate CoA-transferase subunit B
MDFDEKTKRMRLKSVHPGVTVDRVVENTGFELIIPEKVPTTEPPTSEELHILRTKVDPDGALRK